MYTFKWLPYVLHTSSFNIQPYSVSYVLLSPLYVVEWRFREDERFHLSYMIVTKSGFSLSLFFFFFSFLAPPWHMEFQGQGSDHCHSSTARSLTWFDGLGFKPGSHCTQDLANPIVPQQELRNQVFL